MVRREKKKRKSHFLEKVALFISIVNDIAVVIIEVYKLLKK